MTGQVTFEKMYNYSYNISDDLITFLKHCHLKTMKLYMNINILNMFYCLSG